MDRLDECKSGFTHLAIVHFVTVGIVKNDLVRIPGGIRPADKKRCHPPELVLSPGLIGMVVALCAIQSSTHKYANLFRHHLFEACLFSTADEMSRRTVVALGCNSLSRNLVV